MCSWGNTCNLSVPIPADLSHTGGRRWAIKAVDACLADIVQALNGAGIYTRTSCCGHGKESGSIMLEDGRELTLVMARAVGKRELMSDELKPCPVCGRTQQDEEGGPVVGSVAGSESLTAVWCGGQSGHAEVSTPWLSNRAAAVSEWNTAVAQMCPSDVSR